MPLGRLLNWFALFPFTFFCASRPLQGGLVACLVSPEASAGGTSGGDKVARYKCARVLRTTTRSQQRVRIAVVRWVAEAAIHRWAIYRFRYTLCLFYLQVPRVDSPSTGSAIYRNASKN